MKVKPESDGAVEDSNTLQDDSTFSCHENFTLCEEQSLLLSLGLFYSWLL